MINNLKEKVREFVSERDWDKFHNPKNLSMSISIEAAELMEIFQWKTTEESKDIMRTDEAEHTKEEIADVLIYCLSLCNQLDLDVEEIIIDKIRKNALKYPRDKK